MSAPSLSVLTNADVVKVDQDPLGLQAVRVSEPRSGLEVWSKKLAKPGERAVLLLNRTGESSSISVDWSDLGLLGSVASKRKDLWTGKNVSASAKPIAATVPSQDAVLLLVTGQEIAPTRVQPEEMDSPQTPCFATACSNAKRISIHACCVAQQDCDHSNHLFQSRQTCARRRTARERTEPDAHRFSFDGDYRGDWRNLDPSYARPAGSREYVNHRRGLQLHSADRSDLSTMTASFVRVRTFSSRKRMQEKREMTSSHCNRASVDTLTVVAPAREPAASARSCTH